MLFKIKQNKRCRKLWWDGVTILSKAAKEGLLIIWHLSRQPNEATGGENDGGVAWCVQGTARWSLRLKWQGEWPDPAYISKIQTTWLVNRCRLDVGRERKEDMRDYTQVLGLSSCKNGVSYLLDGEDWERREKREFSFGHHITMWVGIRNGNEDVQ